jgi:hypothetical protein
LDTKTILMVFAWIIVLYTWYSLYNLQGKIHCQFHRKDDTVVDKRIKMTDNEVKFGKGTYNVNPKRFSIKWFKLWGIFVYPMIFQEWKWDSSEPLDPKTFKNTPDSPESAQAADAGKSWQQFNEKVDVTGGGKKSSGFERWLPWIAIAGIVVVGFLVYQLSGKLGIIEQQIQSLGGLINKIGK